MRPFLVHASASGKPRSCRTTATYRPDASALPSTVSPHLPRNGLHSLQARKVKVEKDKEKQRAEHSLNAYPFPINHCELGRQGWDNSDHRSEKDSNIASLQAVSKLQEGRSISTQKLWKKNVIPSTPKLRPDFPSL